MSVSEALPVESRLPGFDGATAWLNSPPLGPDELRGKVVVVDFWTYTCINWLRTLGYVRAWADRYGDDGLVVVGVHTPEFPFEQEIENVRRAVSAMRVTYPVALDPEYAVWQAFANHYWPALYLADAEGRIRFHHFGEGRYEECEAAIQQLLREAGRAGIGDDPVAITPEGFEAQADWATLQSPETYLGYGQGRNFAVSGAVRPDESSAYAVPETLALNRWALSGEWTIGERASVTNQRGGKIVFRFHARDVNLVLRSRDGRPIPFRVLVDGVEPGSTHGLDVDPRGAGTLVEPRLYQLVRERETIADRTFEIAFEEAGAEAYVFTFG
jgi:thiol-disulfide isomerase/thioredoxin